MILDDIVKIEMRAAMVLEAERVRNADRTLRLQVGPDRCSRVRFSQASANIVGRKGVTGQRLGILALAKEA